MALLNMQRSIEDADEIGTNFKFIILRTDIDETFFKARFRHIYTQALISSIFLSDISNLMKDVMFFITHTMYI